MSMTSDALRREVSEEGVVIHTWPPTHPDSSGRSNVTEPLVREFGSKEITLGPSTDQEGRRAYFGDPPGTVGGDSVTADKSKQAASGRLKEYDMVSSPKHYDVEDKTYEPRKVIYAWKLNFNRGSAVKYIMRAGKKWNAIEDLEKAKQYIDFEIEELRKEQARNG